MNNEEKILQMLAELSKEQSKLNEAVRRNSVLLEQVGKKQLEQDMKQMEQSVALKSVGKEVTETMRLSKRTAVLLETDYADKLQLLFDGHQTLLETLAPKARVEELAEEVDTLKTVVRLLTHDVAELKKAQ